MSGGSLVRGCFGGAWVSGSLRLYGVGLAMFKVMEKNLMWCRKLSELDVDAGMAFVQGRKRQGRGVGWRSVMAVLGLVSWTFLFSPPRVHAGSSTDGKPAAHGKSAVHGKSAARGKSVAHGKSVARGKSATPSKSSGHGKSATPGKSSGHGKSAAPVKSASQSKPDGAKTKWVACVTNGDKKDKSVSVFWYTGKNRKDSCDSSVVIPPQGNHIFGCQLSAGTPDTQLVVYGKKNQTRVNVWIGVGKSEKGQQPCGKGNSSTIVKKGEDLAIQTGES
ncbi:MAG: hypothetical protein HW380_1973 [Magnetococcales bacterium]|nr:hypothetical protein [Magnetococcales bacterium]